ncbi:sensor histidine kinase [Paenibacillus sp. G2S3]|uniref:sensor histidine kinase n=1 Tax=Paenibacillus sp. G2S3 TaxID=3047872 RepID=UPI0024C1A597|nr:sensor histidine kinase [Paenibacillus sp. G2S3]WHY19365.1 sensor histidine kinase [Paenibacillus sp. G2S3]
MRTILTFFRDRKLKHKLLASYLVVIIIPILVLGVYSYRMAESYLKQQLMLGMKNTVEQISLNLEQTFEKQSNFIDFMVFNPIIKKIMGYELGDIISYTKELNENIEPTLWYYTNINMELKEVNFYSEYTGKQIGNFIYSSEQVQNLDWYQSAKMSNQTEWNYDEGVLFVTHNIMKSNNTTFAGVLYVRLDKDRIFEKMDELNTKSDYGIIITDRNQQVVYSSASSGVEEENIADHILGAGSGQINIGHKEYSLVKSDIERPGWTLYYYTPVKSMIVDTSSILTAMVSIIVVCILILLLIIWIFTKTLVQPIYKLKKKIRVVEEGDFDILIHSNSKDEIGELTNSFASMVRRIKELIGQVYQSGIMEKEAELKALQAQISPHFLYNTLSIINWRAVQVEAEDISLVVNALSKFYRTSLNNGKQLTSIRDEILNIQAYIDIQLAMHDDQLFDVTYHIEESLYPYQTINFILQPIVENAIKHGIDEKEDGKGMLTIEAYTYNDDIRFVVSDNGKGMDQEQIEQLLYSNGTGYGLKNVHERIKLYYGEAYGVSIESELNVGTRICIDINKRSSL